MNMLIQKRDNLVRSLARIAGVAIWPAANEVALRWTTQHGLVADIVAADGLIEFGLTDRQDTATVNVLHVIADFDQDSGTFSVLSDQSEMNGDGSLSADDPIFARALSSFAELAAKAA